MRARVLASLLLTGLTLTACAQLDYHPLQVGKSPDKSSPKKGKLPVWPAKPEATARLAPERSLFGWAIRPPKGFVSTQKQDGLNQVYIFQGDPRTNGMAPALWVVTGTAKLVHTDRSQDEEVMDQYMIQLHQNRDGWQVSPTEAGLIQGRKFLRRRWSGREPINGVMRRLRGIAYLTLTGNKFAAVTLVDSDPDAKATLNIMEPAVFTFHKR